LINLSIFAPVTPTDPLTLGVVVGGSGTTGTKPLLARIAAGLQATPGTVLITGHTDNQPIRTLRYPSNWHLSQDRANAVKALLGDSGVKPERMRAEGKADGEPVESNATPAGRARNRRVEITLIVPASAV